MRCLLECRCTEYAHLSIVHEHSKHELNLGMKDKNIQGLVFSLITHSF